MGLDTEDRLPVGISLEDAYAAVRKWYQANTDRLMSDERLGSHAAASKPYVDSLPPPDRASPDEMRDCLTRVIARDLEWGYHESDGSYKMAAYAHAVLDASDESQS